MYEKIKTVMFGDTEVTIYKNMTGEYFAEYGDSLFKKKIPCGIDLRFIWETISAELGGDDAPTGWDLLEMADAIEKKLGTNTSYGDICVAVEDHIFASERLWPSYVYEEVIAILECRYMHANDVARVKVSPMAPIETWFEGAISSKRIYRLETDVFEDQAVRIIGAHPYGTDYLMEFEMLEFGCDDDDKTFWNVREIFVKPFSACSLIHKPTDELPPEYTEVEE